MRWVWAAFGSIALTLGAIGIFVPLLPTVPFLLLAAFCFSRSSERLHHWLLSHRVFGPPIHNWNTRGAISNRAKKLASISMIAVFALSVFLGLKPVILWIQGITLCLVALFIWTRPSA